MPEGKYFFVKSQLNGLVLDIEGENTAPGTRVVTWEQKEGSPPNQLWYEDHIVGCIRSDLDNDLCLTINDDNRLVVDNFRDEENQHWITSGDLILRRSDHDKVLDIVAQESSPGADVCVWDRHGKANQLWKFEYLEARLFNVVSEMNGMCITVVKEKKLRMHDSNGSDEQLWYEDKHGLLYCKCNKHVMASKKGFGHKMETEFWEAGEVHQMWMRSGNKIINRAQPSEVVDIKGAKQSEGAKIIPYNYNEQSNQHWKFVYV